MRGCASPARHLAANRGDNRALMLDLPRSELRNQDTSSPCGSYSFGREDAFSVPCNLAGDAPPGVLNARRLIARSSLLLLGGQESARLLARILA